MGNRLVGTGSLYRQEETLFLPNLELQQPLISNQRSCRVFPLTVEHLVIE